MQRKVRLVAVALAIGCLSAKPLRATEHISQPFLGVQYAERIETLPRPLYINVIKIDLSEPTLSFRVTSPGPDPRPILGGSQQETIVQTTRQFLDAQGAQVAINASFFATVFTGGWTNNLGLTASNGNKYSPWESPFTADFDDALNITQGNQATIVKMPASIPTGFETTPVVPLYNTVTGSHRVLQNGVNVAPPPGSDSLTQLQPRTAVGVTADNKLLMMTVDGRQLGFSEGVNLVELANLLAGYGAVDAINLDGGGSSTMAFNYHGDANSAGAPYSSRLINSPVGNSNAVATERTVGTNLGLFAAANPNFTPPAAPPPVPAGITVLDDFESNEGHFASDPAASGSTFGVAGSSRIDRVLNESYYGLGSQRITVQTSNPGAPGLALRNLSGGGSAGSNVSFASTGYVGFFLKVLDTGVQSGEIKASLIIDDGPTAHEQALPISVIADGAWHLYQWNLQDAAQWLSFAGGNGQIDAANVTIDSLYLTSSLNLNFNVFFDLLAHNPSGTLSALLPTTPGDFDGDGDVDGADFVVWQTHFPLASGATLAAGDADGDGDVDGADFVVWQTHFPTTGPGAASAVPEPGPLWLILLGLVAKFFDPRVRSGRSAI
jgi:hypothetical protein